MLHCYEIDVVPLYGDRAAAVFSPIISKISGSLRLTTHCEPEAVKCDCDEFVVIMLDYYGVNVTPPNEGREAARPSSIHLSSIRFWGTHNAL